MATFKNNLKSVFSIGLQIALFLLPISTQERVAYQYLEKKKHCTKFQVDKFKKFINSSLIVLQHLNYLFMVGVSVRIALQAFAFHYSNDQLLFKLSQVDVSMSTFTSRYAGNVHLCLAYLSLPLF